MKTKKSCCKDRPRCKKCPVILNAAPGSRRARGMRAVRDSWLLHHGRRDDVAAELMVHRRSSATA